MKRNLLMAAGATALALAMPGAALAHDGQPPSSSPRGEGACPPCEVPDSPHRPGEPGDAADDPLADAADARKRGHGDVVYERRVDVDSERRLDGEREGDE